MAEFNVRSDSVDVEQIMRQIRARIREKRGVDYTEAEVQQLAKVKLEKFLDSRGVRSDLVDQFRRRELSPSPPLRKLELEDFSIYGSHRGALRSIRRMLQPILKLFVNPNPLVHFVWSLARGQAQINEEINQWMRAREHADAKLAPLNYELLHNLVVELTRTGIEVHNLKMRVESLTSRIEFDERRGRSLERVVEYRAPAPQRPAPTAPAVATTAAPSSESPQAAPAPTGRPEGSRPDNDGERRRRRRRRRRRPGQTLADQDANGTFRANASAGQNDASEPQETGDDQEQDRDAGESGDDEASNQ